jgi:hypothetical protein
MLCSLRNGAGVCYLSSSAPLLRGGLFMRRTLLLLATMVTGVLLVSGVAYALNVVTCDGTRGGGPQ